MCSSTAMKRATRLAAALAALVLGPLVPAQAQQAEFERLNQETNALYQQGQYSRAITSASQAVRVAESTFGAEHPNVGTALNGLALMLASQGQYEQVEALYRRALAIYEKAFGANHANVATVLSNLADLYKTQGRFAEAEPLYQRALAIYETTLGAGHPNVAQVLTNIAGVHFGKGQYAQAVELSRRALAIQEKALGAENPVIAISLNNLAYLHMAQAQFAQAEPLLRRALAIYEKAQGPNHPGVAYLLGNLGELYGHQGEYARGEQLLKRSLEIRENALGPEHPDVAVSLTNLATAYRAQGRYAQAEQLYLRALAIVEKAVGAEHTHVAAVLNLLALVYYEQGKYAQIETLFKRALAIREKALGYEHRTVAESLNNLAGLYTTQGRYALAEPLRARSLSIVEKALGREHPDVASNLNDMAYQYFVQDQYAQAEPLYRRALAIREHALGAAHPGVGDSLRDLATVYGKQGRYAEALPLFARALAIAENSFGPEHAAVAACLHKEAELHKAQGQYAKAEPLYKRSLAIIEKIVGPDHPGNALSLNSLAEMYRSQGRHGEALALARRASAIARQRIIAGGTGDAARHEAFTNRAGFFNHLALLARNPGQEAAAAIADEALQIVQLEQTSGTASAVAKMAARFATGDDVLAGLIKRKQDAADRRARQEALLLKAASRPPQQRIAADEHRLREDIVLAAREIETADAELARGFPAYRELTRHEPMRVSQLRPLLQPEEALLVYALGEQSFLWVVRAEGAVFLSLPVDAKDLAAKVATLRAEMDFDSAGKARRVSLDVLHALYQGVFAPALPQLAGITHVLVVPAGPLQSLPFGMLVAAPAAAIRGDADYRKVDWLARRYALSVLPAVSSLQALRQFAKAGRSQEPFAGFGDPLIGAAGGEIRGPRGRMDVAQVFRTLAVKADAVSGAVMAEIADVEAIRQAPRLPETADELRAMGRALKAGENSIWLQERASESVVKGLDLSRYRTIAFATHGVTAGEVKGVGESGLILTPPPQGSAEDDGYLSASEIARLRLDADWVVLSACNTAAADGTPGAEGLSGLAKAFFHAGARSLLVSHWPVASDATVPLTTAMLREYEANPGQGKAAAQRKAILALMNTPSHPEYAHPVFWAPFVVVGEGGGTPPPPAATPRARQ